MTNDNGMLYAVSREELEWLKAVEGRMNRKVLSESLTGHRKKIIEKYCQI